MTPASSDLWGPSVAAVSLVRRVAGQYCHSDPNDVGKAEFVDRVVAALVRLVFAEAKAGGACSTHPPAPTQPAASDLRELEDELCVEAAELPDRTSPDDYPDMLLLTPDELVGFMRVYGDAIRAEAETEARNIAIRLIAEAKAEGWEDGYAAAQRILRDDTWPPRLGETKAGEWAAHFLAANRPSPAGRK